MNDQLITRIAEIARDGVDIHRCAAVQALGHIGTPACIAPLCHALLDEDEDVRIDAAVALSEIADAAAADTLLQSLIGDPSGDVKVAALKGLVSQRYPPVLPWLEKLLVARPSDMAWDEETFDQGGWDDWLDLQIIALEGLGVFAVESAVPAVQAAMADEEGQDLTSHAVTALARMGETGRQAIIDMIDSGDVRLRRRIATQLGDSQTSPDPRVDHALGQFLLDTDPSVRIAAARSIHRRNPSDARLPPLLVNDDPAMRIAIVAMVGADHPTALAELLYDDDRRVVEAALRIVVEYPRHAFEDRVATLFEDELVDDRLLALRALAAIAPDRAREATDSVLTGDDTRLAIGALGLLLDLAQPHDAWPNPFAERLIELATGDFETDTVNASRASVVDTEATGDGTSTLAGIVNADAPTMRRPEHARHRRTLHLHSVRLLAHLAHIDVRAALMDVYAKVLGDVKEEALRSLLAVVGNLPLDTELVIPFVTAQLETAPPSCRKILIDALGRLDGDWVQKVLIQEIDRGPTDRLDLILALANPACYGDDLTAALASPTISHRLGAARALARTARPDMPEHLLQFAFTHEGEHWQEVADLLHVHARDKALAHLSHVLEDHNARECWSVAMRMAARFLSVPLKKSGGKSTDGCMQNKGKDC